MRICMFVKNSFEYDARVTKEARSLLGAGHEVTVVALHVPGVTEQFETTADGIRVVRVTRVNLGIDTVNRLVRRYVGTVERRHERLTGTPVDPERLRSASLTGPTVGIGAGPGCDGQVLVSYDALGLNPSFGPKFLKRFAHLHDVALEGVREYAREVREGSYPAAEHSFDEA